MQTPPVRYANSDGLAVAYMVAGEGPHDLVYVSNWTSNVELFWEDRLFGRMLRRLATIGRVILFDQPGTGLSDPVSLSELPTMEQWMGHMLAVMDAAGSERVHFIAPDSGGPLGILFAATHPERVASLTLVGSFARLTRADDYPAGYPADSLDAGHAWWMKLWTTGGQVTLTAPDVASDPHEMEAMGRAERHSASPGVADVLFRMIGELDVRHVLPALHVPTLVLHREGDRWIEPAHSRYLAENIEGAKLVMLPGDNHYLFYGDLEAGINEIRRFITSAVPARSSERVLATVLFTDIVGSTELAVSQGDGRWKRTLNAHDTAVRDALNLFRGREVKTTGDGVFAAFDGPARAVRCAAAIRESARALDLDIRAGVHTGECEVRGDDLGGIAVHVASRVMSEANPGEILVSSTVKDLVVGSGLTFEDRGARALKGAGDWRLFSYAG